jgi:type II secretory pathway pseudopilin PulG
MKALTILIPMHLAGQDAKQQSEKGYAMAALIVAIAVLAVVMTAAMPVWKHLAQREKEEELVFRGEQIAHSIGLFQRRNANAYPPSIDALVKGRFLRKKYQDPIANADFVPIPQAQQGNQPGQQQPGRGQPAATPAQGGLIGGVMGVTSKSTAESIRLYKGRSHYNEWAFIYTPPAAAPGAGGVPGAGVPGGRGRGQGQGQGQGQPGFPGAGGIPRGNAPGPFQPGPNGPARRNSAPGQPPTTFTPGMNFPQPQRGR